MTRAPTLHGVLLIPYIYAASLTSASIEGKSIVNGWAFQCYIRGVTRARFIILIGIGSDIIEIPRIAKSIQRFSERFLDRVFTPGERLRSDNRADPPASYAKRFAAKEAFVKALGLGISNGILWRDVEVVNISTGQPTIHVHGRAAELLAEKVRPYNKVVVHVSLSDTAELAQAFVVLEVIPDVNG